LALALHLAFHELATNARKHGALSSPFGRVELPWDLLPADRAARKLAILWSEHDGPQVNEPQRKGFGLSLITGALTPGNAELSFELTGVVCRILVDLDHPPPETPDDEDQVGVRQSFQGPSIVEANDRGRNEQVDDRK
jgi:two-component sensor histidine kinase